MRVIRRAGVTAGAAFLLVSEMSGQAASASVSCSNPGASMFAGMSSAQAGLNCPGAPAEKTGGAGPKHGKSGTGAKPACVWVPKPDYQRSPGEKADGDGGHWSTKFCSFGEYNTLADFENEMGTWDAMNTRQSNIMQRAGLETLFTTPPPTPRRAPQQVMESVADELPYPETFIAVNPAPAKQVVGVPTWVWLTGKDGTVSPGAAGEEQTCTGTGVPESDISGPSKTATKALAVLEIQALAR